MQHPLKSCGIIISSEVSLWDQWTLLYDKNVEKEYKSYWNMHLIVYFINTWYFDKEKYLNEIISNQNCWDCLGKWRIIWTWDRSPVLAVQVLHSYQIRFVFAKIKKIVNTM